MTQAILNRSGLMSQQTDMEVLRDYANSHNSDAFAEIFHRHAGFVFSTCLRVLGDATRAQDASQETFFRLMQRPHEIKQSLGAWLHRTATHLSVDALRSESARRRREIIYDTTRDHQASTWAELSPAVDQAISELPDELRVLMVQHFLLGKSQTQLATETGQSPATICRRMQQGLDQLRQRLRLKGIHALPAALAGLLCHAAARQAPASLIGELGKMAMYAGATNHPASAAAGKSLSASARTGAWIAVKVIAVILSFLVGMLILQWAISHWFAAPSQQINHRDDNQPRHLHEAVILGRTV